MRCRSSEAYSGATGLAAGRISAGSRGASDSLLSKGTVAFEKDSAHTMGDGAKVEPDFNIFTAPRVKPSVFSKFLSNIPKPGDWLNLDFGAQPAFAGIGSINQKPL